MNVKITWQALGVMLAILVGLSSTIGTFYTVQYRVAALEVSVSRIDANVQWLLGEAIREGWVPPKAPPASSK